MGQLFYLNFLKDKPTMKKTLLILTIPIFLLLVVIGNRLSNQSASMETTSLQLNSSIAPLDVSFVKCQLKRAFDFTEKDPSEPIAPLFDNLGDHHFEITASSEKAQAYFDQGIRLLYAFNHAEAHRSFREVARLDPKCAMAYWGQAIALGPNINDPIPDAERTTKAFEAANKARDSAAGISKKEKKLIEALQTRQQKDPGADRQELNVAYAQAMVSVAAKFSKDADVQTLYAAALMNTMPWNYWTNEGAPNPGTLTAKSALEKAMQINSDHAGAHHYYIHMMELPKPDLAEASADRLGSLMPGAGHLVHMPGHIYFRIGRYKDARIANVKAIEADEDYISQCLAQGLYPLSYYPHNIHFLWSAASMEGNSGIALDAAQKTASRVPRDQVAEMPFMEDFLSTPLLAQVRFGKWNGILLTPHPGNSLKHVRLVWHYARGLAFVAKNDLPQAQEELEALQELARDPDLEGLLANYMNPSSSVIPIAIHVLSGEMAAAQGQIAKAVGLLEKGVAYEEQLIYSEPPAWHIPVRHNLGAVLLQSGQAREAQTVYENDLKVNRENGWSLFGLYQSHLMQGDRQKVVKYQKRFSQAWEEADVAITASRF
jgi:tetratricopeptide (TPR) repeat protein